MERSQLDFECSEFPLFNTDHHPQLSYNISMKSTRPLLTAAAIVLFVSGLSATADTLNNNFTTAFDYVGNGIVGDTNWDGVYLRFGDITGGSAGTDGNGD